MASGAGRQRAARLGRSSARPGSSCLPGGQRQDSIQQSDPWRPRGPLQLDAEQQRAFERDLREFPTFALQGEGSARQAGHVPATSVWLLGLLADLGRARQDL
eukprot:3581761-Pyramimonas_sp.AAC.1